MAIGRGERFPQRRRGQERIKIKDRTLRNNIRSAKNALKREGMRHPDHTQGLRACHPPAHGVRLCCRRRQLPYLRLDGAEVMQ